MPTGRFVSQDTAALIFKHFSSFFPCVLLRMQLKVCSLLTKNEKLSFQPYAVYSAFFGNAKCTRKRALLQYHLIWGEKVGRSTYMKKNPLFGRIQGKVAQKTSFFSSKLSPYDNLESRGGDTACL